MRKAPVSLRLDTEKYKGWRVSQILFFYLGDNRDPSPNFLQSEMSSMRNEERGSMETDSTLSGPMRVPRINFKKGDDNGARTVEANLWIPSAKRRSVV